jgi:SAM-dependent methyltransferase
VQSTSPLIRIMIRPRYVSYFDFQAELGRSFLHPGGETATDRLLALLPALRKDQIVLELGCGRGGTAVKLLGSQPCTYIGLDASGQMAAGARAALQRFGDRAHIVSGDLSHGPLPARSGIIDAVIAESVIAILDPLPVLRECRRVLKMQGMLLLIDRLWSDSVPPVERARLNHLARRHYGFSLAAEHPATISEWVAAAEEIGLHVRHKELVPPVPPGPHGGGNDRARRLRLLWQLCRPRMLAYYLYDRFMLRKHVETWRRMENWLMVFLRVR